MASGQITMRKVNGWQSLAEKPLEDDSMRVLIALLVIAYLVGVGVALAPTIKANWSTGPASQFVESVATELPSALSWPATVYRSIAEKPSAPEKRSAPE